MIDRWFIDGDCLVLIVLMLQPQQVHLHVRHLATALATYTWQHVILQQSGTTAQRHDTGLMGTGT